MAGLILFGFCMWASSTFIPDSVLLLIAMAAIGFLSVKFIQVHRRQHFRDFGGGIDSQSPYAILGVNPQASDEEIQLAYYVLVETYRTDFCSEAAKENAAVLLSRINLAFEMIGDEDSRLTYDALAHYHAPNAPNFDEAYQHVLARRRPKDDLDDE